MGCHVVAGMRIEKQKALTTNFPKTRVEVQNHLTGTVGGFVLQVQLFEVLLFPRNSHTNAAIFRPDRHKILV